MLQRLRKCAVNVHHLELFYYVARHGGVSAAARHMPYGIQQPAISSQILQLEAALGAPLFHRRPFKLTRQGEMLFEFAKPFFSRLDEMGKTLRGGAEELLRIAAPEIVQRDYLPALLGRLRKRLPGFQFTLHSGRIEEVERMLLAQEIDIGLASYGDRRPEGVQLHELLSLPMVLLVPAASKLRDASVLWKQDRIAAPLITLPHFDPLCRVFIDELRKRKCEWRASLEVSSLDLVHRYVAEGYGVGLGVAAPKKDLPPGVRMLPLKDFPEVGFGALWLGRLSPVGEVFLDECCKLASTMKHI